MVLEASARITRISVKFEQLRTKYFQQAIPNSLSAWLNISQPETYDQKAGG
jgi:hypothetical protein